VGQPLGAERAGILISENSAALSTTPQPVRFYEELTLTHLTFEKDRPCRDAYDVSLDLQPDLLAHALPPEAEPA
jgi:hypothetical protein